MKRLLLLLVACRGTSREPVGTPEQARALTAELMAAVAKCDQNAIDAVVDPMRLAKRAGGDDRFAKLALDAWHLSGPCGEDKLQVAATPNGIRFEHQQLGLVDGFGFLVLVPGGKPARVIDIKAPLFLMSVVDQLTLAWGEPVGDHAGRVGDAMYFPFQRVPSAGLVLTSGAEADVNAKPPAENKLGEMLAYGTAAWNALAVEKTVTKIEAIVGRDPYLQDLVAIVHRNEPEQMLDIARAVTRDFPDIADGWITQLYAEAITGDFDAAMTTLDTLVTKHHFDYRLLGKSLAMARFTATPAFAQKYRL